MIVGCGIRGRRVRTVPAGAVVGAGGGSQACGCWLPWVFRARGRVWDGPRAGMAAGSSSLSLPLWLS